MALNNEFGLSTLTSEDELCLFLSMAFLLDSFFRCYQPWPINRRAVSLTRKGLSAPKQHLRDVMHVAIPNIVLLSGKIKTAKSTSKVKSKMGMKIKASEISDRAEADPF